MAAKSNRQLIDQMNRAWKVSGVRSTCEMCRSGSPRWNFLGDDGTDAGALPLAAAGSMTGASLGLYLAVCADCGNVRFFEAGTIDRLAP